MLSHKVQVKLYVREPRKLELEAMVPVFHDWIRRDLLGELMIDVADYSHVPGGPGVLLVGHGSDYFLDTEGGRTGLLYSRKRDAPDDVMTDALKRALIACELIESEPELGVQFSTDELEVCINDRLRAPNTHETFEAVRPELEACLRKLFAGDAFSLEPVGGPKDPFVVRVKSVNQSPVADLLARVS